MHQNRIAIVHRPKYNDWSLPKGKLQSGETFEDTALREVYEETHCLPLVNYFAGALHYSLNKEYKLVLFWVMTSEKMDNFIPNNEIDDLKWIKCDAAKKWLHYQKEIELLKSAFPEKIDKYRLHNDSLRHMYGSMNTLNEAIFILEQNLNHARKEKIFIREKNLSENLEFLYRFKDKIIE